MITGEGPLCGDNHPKVPAECRPPAPFKKGGVKVDFGFTEEQEKLRKEYNEFLINELPVDHSGHVTALNEKMQSFYMNLQEKVAKKGWLTAGWPKEYGGLGLGAIGQGVVNEVEGYWQITMAWPNLIGLLLAGPALILFGSEEQKKRFIPPIARGEVVWFEAFTEPDAGTDESNIQARAIAEGDDFIINGQKIFISGAYKPDYLYTEVRTLDTTPRHRGLTLFLIPADTPGITYRPLPTMGFGVQNEIFFDDVRVPKEYMLGELNRGFYHAMATFEFERSNTGIAAGAKRNLEEFVQFCKEEKGNGKPLIEDPQVRDALAQMAVEVEVWRLASWRTAWRFDQREKLGPLDYDLAGFYTKVFSTRHAKVMMDILGPYGQLRQSSKWAELAGWVERRWQTARSLHAAGTFEVYKIVLAGRGLGLPRIPARLNPVIKEALGEKR